MNDLTLSAYPETYTSDITWTSYQSAIQRSTRLHNSNLQRRGAGGPQDTKRAS